MRRIPQDSRPAAVLRLLRHRLCKQRGVWMSRCDLDCRLIFQHLEPCHRQAGLFQYPHEPDKERVPHLGGFAAHHEEEELGARVYRTDTVNCTSPITFIFLKLTNMFFFTDNKLVVCSSMRKDYVK